MITEDVPSAVFLVFLVKLVIPYYAKLYPTLIGQSNAPSASGTMLVFIREL